MNQLAANYLDLTTRLIGYGNAGPGKNFSKWRDTVSHVSQKLLDKNNKLVDPHSETVVIPEDEDLKGDEEETQKP